MKEDGLRRNVVSFSDDKGISVSAKRGADNGSSNVFIRLLF